MTKVRSSDKWSSEGKFAVVLETTTLSEVELSEYCRVKGLYPEQIKAWKQACVAGNTKTKQVKRVNSAPEKKSDKNRIKALERELRRKKSLSRDCRIARIRKKVRCLLEGKRGQLISLTDRHKYAQWVSIAIAGLSLSRRAKDMMVLMLKYWRNEKCCIREKEMSILSDGQKKKETGSQ